MKKKLSPVSAKEKQLKLRLGKPNYAQLGRLREEILNFAKMWMLDSEDVDAVLLAVNEIITNLIKHPAEKASRIEVVMTVQDNKIHTDIADDSTSFISFERKCEAAKKLKNASVTLSEGGYGLHCILTLQDDVQYIQSDKSDDGLNHFILGRNRRKKKNSEQALSTDKRGLIYAVDDNRLALEMTRAALEGHHLVQCFLSPLEALEAFKAKKPDMVISDYYMPEMNGEEFRLALSKLKGGDETPFVFLSGSDEKSHPYLSRLGIDDFLSKPLNAEKLVKLTDRLLRRSEQLKSVHTSQFNNQLIEALKPALPPHEGLWQMQVRYSLAEAGGGDFIFHSYADDGLNILLADVMGHGAGAKFFAYAYAGYLRSIFRMENGVQSPAQFLDQLSKSISGDELLENVIMTCIALKLKKNGEAHLATAGHPAPFLFRKGVLNRIELRGPLPGLSIGLARQMLTLNLEEGDSLVLMTDGMTDIMETIKAWPVFETDISNSLADYIWHQFRKRSAVKKSIEDDSTLIVIGRGGKK